MRTLESYVSGFNQKYAMSSPTNCNQWNSRAYNKRKKYRDDTSTSSISDNHYRKNHHENIDHLVLRKDEE